MKNTVQKISILTGIVFLLFAGGCIHDEFDIPDQEETPVGEVISIADLRQIYADSVQSGIYPEGYKFTEDYSAYCVVTMDDKSGNIYKSAYVQGNSAAINLHLKSSGGVYEGDSIRLYLKGLVLGDYEGMLQIDSVDVNDNVLKIATLQDKTPELVSIPEIKGNPAGYQAKLIELEGVQFIADDTAKTFANADDLVTENRTLEDCNGQTIIVRTSGYADFADMNIPTGRGSLVAIVGQFRDDMQLYVRSMAEVHMEGNRCGEFDAILDESFESLVPGDTLSIEGWSNIAIAGDAYWEVTNIQGGAAKAVSLDPTASSESDFETWLITSEIDLSASSAAFLSFVTRNGNVTGDGGSFSVQISNDYDGTNPAAATWNPLSAVVAESVDSGYTDYISSGEVDLDGYTGTVHIAFKYTGSQANRSHYILDEVLVAE